MDLVTVDFETEAIVGNPIVKPPRPVGVSIWVPGSEPTYLAWGHPTENNCSYDTAHQYLIRLVESGCSLLFHNAAFDISVWNRWFCNAQINWINDGWRRIHDTMFLLFLRNPYSSNLSLKPSAHEYLGMPPDEQTELTDWIVANVPEATRKNAGAYIARAPGDLVGRYANGDAIRTRKLYDLLHPQIVELGMEAAYDRERRLLPILMEATEQGIRIDRERLEWHEKVYTQCREMAADQLATKLDTTPAVLESDELLADALERSGAVTEWTLTKTGKRSMAKDNLKIVIPEVKILLDYTSVLDTCLGTFMRPWLEKSASDGRLHPNWNQVRQPRGDFHSKGTRTGRLSSDDPNFQNVPTEFTDALGNPLPVPEGLHHPPYMRSYCLPEVGHVWIKRDFSSQEVRILAHFEDGSLAEAYRANPSLDPHRMAMELIHSMIGVLYARKDVKITGFSIIYGTGARGLAIQLGRDYEEAFAIKNAYLAAMPGIQTLMRGVQDRGRAGEFIRTWGGRIYYAEPGKEVNGRWMDFYYKLLNYLIQGSAADQTKESVCDWEDARHWDDVFLATVHDELNVSAPKEHWKESMVRLKESMNKDRLDVPMLSDGYVGPNWHELEKCE